MGLLAKSLKKANAAKTEPFDFESQYERLAELTETAPKPPKVSLRERAKSFLRRAAHPMGESIDAPHKNSERPKLSLRERARRLLQKIKNEPSGSEGGGGSASAHRASGGISSHSGTTPVTPMTPPTHSAAALGENGDALPADEETLLYSIFPWNKINAEGELEPTISFGEYSAEDCGLTGPLSNASPDEENSSRESPSTEPLTTFATTMERITENLRNLHSQLDQGNLIRNVHVESAATPVTNAPQGEFTSHHVSLDTAGEEAHPTRMATENAKDVFWPKTLPIDLPARDIKIGGDGRLSVVPGPFQIPYLAADIIPPESEFSYFHRSLKSAELFIGEGEIQLAKIIYERLLKKISDKAIKEKIQKNLDALEDYRKSHDWGNFLPVPPWNQNAWQKNPWHEMPEAKVNVSQMPVEAQNITINMDKGFFEIARALFELKDSILEKKGTADGAEKEPSTEGKVDGVDEGGNPAEDLRGGEDRRKGGIDTWGEG
ncbi:MAG TPA: hypothetical protein PLY93_05545, partial [Turneriella sp.]|nr:hypothetical protein [Turneriella sp.]